MNASLSAGVENVGFSIFPIFLYLGPLLGLVGTVRQVDGSSVKQAAMGLVPPGIIF